MGLVKRCIPALLLPRSAGEMTDCGQLHLPWGKWTSRLHNSHDRNRHTCTYAIHTYTWHNWTYTIYTCTHTIETCTYTWHLHPLCSSHTGDMHLYQTHSPTPVSVTHNKLCAAIDRKKYQALALYWLLQPWQLAQQVPARTWWAAVYDPISSLTDSRTETDWIPASRPDLTRAAGFKILDQLFLLYSYMIYLDNR